MTIKRVLLVGMLDSVHVGRWISQFEGTEIYFTLFASKKFRSINSRILNSLAPHSEVKIKLVNRFFPRILAGYFDFLLYVIPSKLGFNFREWHLAKVVNYGRFDFIHALEIQGAGYLVDESIKILNRKHPKVILTNWGSDIYYFMNFPNHKKRIESALASADFYSAECVRDYTLAHELGFAGTNLPCIPNAGGFKLNQQLEESTSKRKQIIVKCYGGELGRGQLILGALREVLPNFSDFSVLLYSVTEDLMTEVLELATLFPQRIRFSSRNNPFPHQELMAEFEKSRVYLGASVSDGISTSFLEALVHGCYPIQTNSSCANEWILLGAIGSTPSLVESEIASILEVALSDDYLVDTAQIANMQLAREYLDFDKVREVAMSFYIS